MKLLLALVLSLFILGCATTQKVPLNQYSTPQLYDMLNQINAQLDSLQYIPYQKYEPQTSTSVNVYTQKRNPFLEGVEIAQRQNEQTNANIRATTSSFGDAIRRSQIQNLLYQRASIITELKIRGK